MDPRQLRSFRSHRKVLTPLEVKVSQSVFYPSRFCGLRLLKEVDTDLAWRGTFMRLRRILPYIWPKKSRPLRPIAVRPDPLLYHRPDF